MKSITFVLMVLTLSALAGAGERINPEDVCKCYFIRENNTNLLVSININKDVVFYDQATINFTLRDDHSLLLNFSCMMAKYKKSTVNGAVREEMYGWDFTISPEMIGKMELTTFFSYKDNSYKLVIKSGKNSNGKYIPIINISEYLPASDGDP